MEGAELLARRAGRPAGRPAGGFGAGRLGTLGDMCNGVGSFYNARAHSTMGCHSPNSGTGWLSPHLDTEDLKAEERPPRGSLVLK